MRSDEFDGGRARKLINDINESGLLPEPLNEARKTYYVKGGEKVDIDSPVPGGQRHGHHRSGVVNVDGTASHGTNGHRVSKPAAALFRSKGFYIPPDRFIECADDPEAYIVDDEYLRLLVELNLPGLLLPRI